MSFCSFILSTLFFAWRKQSTKAIQEIVSPFNKQFTSDIKKRILGLRGLEWASIVINELGLTEDDEAFQDPATMVRLWEDHLHCLLPEVTLVDGVNDFLERIQQDQARDNAEEGEEETQKRWKMAIATSSNSHSGLSLSFSFQSYACSIITLF